MRSQPGKLDCVTIFRRQLPAGIGVNRPAIVREIPHFGLFPAFPHFCQNIPHLWPYFENTQIAENRNTFSCTETFCSKKLYENVSDSVTVTFDSKIRQKSLKIAKMFTVGDTLFE